MALADVQIKAVPGETRLLVDGADVSNEVAALTLRCENHQLPKVYLELNTGHGEFSGQAEVYVVQDSVGPAEWLAAIDPEILGQLIDEKLQIEPGSYPELCLAVLRELASVD